MTLQGFLDHAIDGGKGILQKRCTTFQHLPACALIAGCALHAVTAGKTVGQQLMLGTENIDAEMAMALDDGPGACRAV